ncbi:MAG: GTP 3',8-cyclase MoaA [Pyrinomonadaceae bacterium MAG19_C2-C3]|nr:GTP 3',8-cyclase MoaA [Pyrinomonadaceae bacterium MAG19_C2-C3]
MNITPLKDSYHRPIRDLRVSVTDRCNFRCFYCLPHGEPPAAPKSQMLTYEEIELACRIFVRLGIEKIRLTGGEPLMRRDIEILVARVAAIDGIQDLALTTNGYFLPDRAGKLKDAGLNRITISLDSLNPERFKRMTGVDVLDRVLEGIRAAKRAGLEPIKINSVIVRGHNDGEVADMAQFAREHDAQMRFIEFMPLDSGHDWRRADVVSGKEIRARIEERFPLVPVHMSPTPLGSETATRFRFADGAPGEIGIIAPVTQAFCGACSRIRLTADGQIRTCLFSKSEHSLRDVIRGGANEDEIMDFIRAVVWRKEASHNIGSHAFVQPARTMSLIGG